MTLDERRRLRERDERLRDEYRRRFGVVTPRNIAESLTWLIDRVQPGPRTPSS